MQSFLHKKFVSEFRYLAAFSNAGGSKLSDILNDAKFPLFAPPPPVKTMGGVGEILYQLLKLYLYG